MDNQQGTKSMSQEQANDMNELPVKLINSFAVTNLQQLNEYCLREIFLVKSLDPMDLCALAETCELIRRITQSIAPKTLEINIVASREFEVKFGNYCITSRDEIERIFKNFGSTVSVVDVRGQSDSDQSFLLQLIVNHCNELEELNFSARSGSAGGSFLQSLQTLKCLQSLELCNVEFNDFKLFSEEFRELRELRLWFCDLPRQTQQFAHLTQLKKLALNFCGSIDLVVRIIGLLTDLEVMESWSTLDEKTFSKILAIVKGRSKVLTLSCPFEFDVKNYNDDQKVKLINKKINE